MTNELFDDESVAVVLNQANWRVVGSLLDEEVDFIHRPAHLNWMHTHTESHPAREVLFALKGQGIYGYKNNVYPCSPGTVFFFNSYESHDQFYPPTCPDMIHLWLGLFERDVVAKILSVKGGVIKVTGSPLVLNDAPTARLLATTWDELLNPSALPPPLMRAKLLASLSALLLRIVEWGHGEIVKHKESNFQNQVIETICRHVAQTAGRDVPLCEAARLSGYSKFHFLRLFKQETGQTFHDYVNECRLKKVTAMLQERRTKIEISETLGFTHPSTFIRWMKAQKNIMDIKPGTPAQNPGFSNLVAFGDSITRGYANPPGAGWVELLPELMKKNGNNKAINVFNAGGNGNTSTEGLKRIEADVLAHMPGLVLVEFGGNDSVHDARAVSVDDFERNLTVICEKVRAKGGEIILVTFPPVVNEWHSTRADPFYAKWGGLDKCVEQYRQRTRAVAQRLNCPLFDMDKLLRPLTSGKNRATYLNKDGIHLTPQSNKLVASAFFKFLIDNGKLDH
ncbi:MAG: GDSL-type esterase/lipase family protein [bacterium]